MTRDPTLAQKIRAGLLRGEADAAIAARLGTTLRAVAVVRKGVRATCARLPSAPAAAVAAHEAKFFICDGSNVAGWSQIRGKPRLVQVLALCRWASRQGAFCSWFDASFLGCLTRYSAKDARVLTELLRREPACFKQAPSGYDARHERIRADDFCLRDAALMPGSVIVTDDRFRKERKLDPVQHGWVQAHPERVLPGHVASNGDLLIGAHAEIHIPVVDDAEYYLTH